MPETPTSKPHTLSPADMVLGLIEEMRDQPAMAVGQKLDELAELRVERIAFPSPEQAMKVIAALGQVIESDANPEVRLAALEVMKRMMDLEKMAEHKPGAPKMDWTVADLIFGHARKEASSAPAAASAPHPADKPSLPSAKPDIPAMQYGAAERPHPPGRRLLAEEGVSPAAFMRILRSVAGTDGEEAIRKVAGRMIETIEQQSAQIAPSRGGPAFTEG